MSLANESGGGVKAEDWGGLGWLKERQNSNYFIVA